MGQGPILTQNTKLKKETRLDLSKDQALQKKMKPQTLALSKVYII